MRVRGAFQKAETRNANGRIYPSSLWERVLGDISLKNTIESRRMLGCVEHPSSGVTALSEVSHIVTNLTRSGNEIIGEAEILNTPQGLIIQELLRRGVPVGISSRGRGSAIMRNGVEYVNPDDFVLETFDFVYKPSTPGAYPELQESVLAGSPFAKNTPMSAKVDQIKKFDVRATDITSAASGKVQLADLHKLHTESIEIQASMQALLGGFSEVEAKEHGSYANEVTGKIEGALQAVRSQLDKHYSVSDLSRKAESVLNSNAGSDVFKTLLAEATQENNYLRSRLDELTTILESNEDDLMRRYNAAAQLAEETLDKLHDLTGSLSEMQEERDEIKSRYEAAVELVAQLQEAQTLGQMALQVQEALDTYPALGKFQKTLRACKTKEELDERVEELVSGLGLTQPKSESLISRVKLSGAITESRKPSQPTESVDTKVLNPNKKNLTESAAKTTERRASAKQILESSKEDPQDDILANLLETNGLS